MTMIFECSFKHLYEYIFPHTEAMLPWSQALIIRFLFCLNGGISLCVKLFTSFLRVKKLNKSKLFLLVELCYELRWNVI